MTRFVALASDYDGTLAHDGAVSQETLQALESFRQTGRKIILVSGRVLSDLETVFNRFDLFDCIVAENGGVLYIPATKEKRALAPPPKKQFIDALQKRRVNNLGVGDTIVATWHPHETEVLEVIRDLGLELHVIFNKGAVMVLPSGVNKKSGLQAALDSLCLSEHNVVGVGDAENDHAFLEYCECSVAVANALEAVKQTADFTTHSDHGGGVAELIHMIVNGDLDCPGRRAIPIGTEGNRPVSVPPFGSSLLVGGTSGSGKSTFVAGWLETLSEQKYQFCLIDPEGDYESLPNTVLLGDEKNAPSVDQVIQALQKPTAQVVVNLMSVPLGDRPKFLDTLLPRLLEMRARIGRPHWIVVDEAHHMLPPNWTLPSAEIPGGLQNMVLITVHPEHIAPTALRAVDTVLAMGKEPASVFEAFANTLGVSSRQQQAMELPTGELLSWFLSTGQTHRLKFRLAQAERRRHRRNYAIGELGPENSFYFRGPHDTLNLRAQNLSTFLQLAEGIDDETWNYHLSRGDYSRWFREAIKDDELADDAAQYERPDALSPRESREGIKGAVERRYTAPA